MYHKKEEEEKKIQFFSQFFFPTETTTIFCKGHFEIVQYRRPIVTGVIRFLCH